MVAWIPNTNFIGYQPIANVNTTQQHPVGTRVLARHETYGFGEFIYLKGVASVVLGDWVTYSLLSGLTTRGAADAVGPVAIAMNTCTTTTTFGWFQIYGLATGTAGGAIAINTQIYSKGAGDVDDAVVDGDMIHNALCVSTVTASGAATGVACFFIWYPYQDNIAGND